MFHIDQQLSSRPPRRILHEVTVYDNGAMTLGIITTSQGRDVCFPTLPLLLTQFSICCNCHSRNIVINSNKWLKWLLEVRTMRKIPFKHLGCRLRQYWFHNDIKMSTKSRMPHIMFNEWPTQVHTSALRKHVISAMKLYMLHG